LVNGSPVLYNLPAVILFHAGGYAECSNKNLPGISKMCEEFALRGFIAFNVEYRRGRMLDLDDPTYTSVQQELAIYRACQDVRGAIRTILKRQDEHFENSLYRVNKNQIFIGGMSAGGLAAMNAAYYTTDAMIAETFPTIGIYSAQQIMGSINADYYYGEPSIEFQPNIKGVLSMWGAISLPKRFNLVNNQSSFFAGNTYNPPMIAFAGAKDQVFPLKPSTLKQQEFFFLPV
jgi:acetyl esterase/lipase